MADRYVNGRRLLLQMLDSLLAEDNNIKAFKTVFQQRIDEDAMKFWGDVVQPLMPKESLALTDAEENKGLGSVVIEFKPKQQQQEE